MCDGYKIRLPTLALLVGAVMYSITSSLINDVIIVNGD